MSTKQSKYVWSFNRFLPQFGDLLSPEQYLVQNNSKYTICQYYSFLERQYSVPLKHLVEELHGELNIPLDIINIITVYNSGGIIYDYTKTFEQYTKGNVVYITPIILGYIETALFISLFVIMYLMHFEWKYAILPYPNAYDTLNAILLWTAVVYSLLLCIHTICVLISYRQCRHYEVIIRHFKRSIYSNRNFTHHVRMIDLQQKLDCEHNDDDESTADSHSNSNSHNEQRLMMRVPTQSMNIEMQTSGGTLDLSDDEDGDSTAPHYNDVELDMSSSGDSFEDSDIIDRWQWKETYKDSQQTEFLSTILNPSNNSFAYVAYQRWLNVKKLELENDSFTRSKSALVLNLSKYWLTSYFTMIIILIFVIPNSVYLYFAFVLTLFVMYYCYLRTIKNMEHSAALKKVLYLFCSFIIGTIITLIIIFTTEDTATTTSGGPADAQSNHAMQQQEQEQAHSQQTAAQQGQTKMNAESDGITFWIFDVVFPVLEGVFALLYTYITCHLVYKIVKYERQGYHLWLCCVNAFGFWLLTFWIPSWKLTEISIACTGMLLTSCYLYLQQISHRIMTGLDKEEYIEKHCAPKPKTWLKNELRQLFVPYTYRE